MWKSITILPTILVKLSINGKCIGYFRAMCDTGSQVNLARYDIIKQSKHATEPANLNLIGITENSMRIKKKITATIQPWFDFEDSKAIDTEFLLLPKTSQWTPIYPPQSISYDNITEPIRTPVADPYFWQSGIVPLLLGIEIYSRILDGATRKIGTNLIEQTTAFGNAIMCIAIKG